MRGVAGLRAQAGTLAVPLAAAARGAIGDGEPATTFGLSVAPVVVSAGPVVKWPTGVSETPFSIAPGPTG